MCLLFCVRLFGARRGQGGGGDVRRQKALCRLPPSDSWDRKLEAFNGMKTVRWYGTLVLVYRFAPRCGRFCARGIIRLLLPVSVCCCLARV